VTGDHVDRILEQWRQERPDLDVTALGTIARLIRAVGLAEQVLGEPLRGLGLQPGWFDLLAALRRAGGSYELSPTELRHATLLSSGGMTKRIDTMIDAGLVTRRRDPDDRRGVLVRLTAKGRSVIDRAVEVHAAGEEELLRALPAADRRTLDRVLSSLLASLEARTGESPASARSSSSRRRGRT
jgi:DNA-binding MarR family transcriptional regulator